MSTPWVPAQGVLVKDTAAGRVGKAVGWDGDTRTVTLAPVAGDDETWETQRFRPPNELDRLRARVTEVNNRRRRT
ncbi:hypothetical protein ACFY12_28470 [Streptomyces sp. NPDC001339]|uniref:hypothetical protein n=1 Tax=Streptomyces sp. NPDC001339 TaxID=3364563 RepID=UPI00369D031C